MNTIGIDYQHIHTRICVNEGHGVARTLCAVGDGYRKDIPTAALPEGLLGTPAFCSNAKTASEGVVFWRSLALRLEAFLGAIAPVKDNGYRLVVAVAQPVVGRDEILSSARMAGLEEVDLISSTQALLARWAGLNASAATPEYVTAIVVGDEATYVSAFRLQWGGASLSVPTVLAYSETREIAGAGHCVWGNRVFIAIRERAKSEPPTEVVLAIRDATCVFARKLGASEAALPIEWTGPFANDMYTRLYLSRAQCQEWSEVATLIVDLPSIVAQVSADLGASRPDLILLGGRGAVWPFARSAVARVAPLWVSGNPAEDLAAGAAWSNDTIVLDPPGVMRPLGTGDTSLSVPTTRPLLSAPVSRGITPPVDDSEDEPPPWLRHNTE